MRQSLGSHGPDRPQPQPAHHEPTDRGGSPRRLWTMGSSTRTMAELLTLLRAYGIQTLVDVRRFPVSRRFPHFTRDALARSLRRAGIRYLHLGEDLGGFRRGGFDAYMATPAFVAGLRTLEFTAGRSPAAIMCAERHPSQCHRRYIALAMSQRGWDVVHVIEPGRTWTPADRESPELPLGETGLSE